MDIANKLITVAENVNKVYEAGYNKAESENPLPYIKTLSFGFGNTVFPENFHFKLNLKKTPSDLNGMCNGAVNIKIATLSSEDKSNKIQMYNAFNNNKLLELLDLTNFNNNFSGIGFFVGGCPKLKTILGAINLSSCTQTKYAFIETSALENIEFVPNTIPISIDFSYCKKLTHKSLMSIINGLAVVETTQTLTLGTTNLAKLTNEEKAIATEKGWSLA